MWQKDRAVSLLAEIRNCNWRYFLSSVIRELLKEEGLTLEDIGTSEEELKSIRKNGTRQRALGELNRLRSGKVHYTFYKREIHQIRCYLKMGVDIDTSEEELESLRIEGYRLGALRWLKLLEKGSTKPERFLTFLRKELKHGNLTPADIGTTEERLQSFVTKR